MLANLKNIYLEEAEDLFRQLESSLLLLDNSPEDPSLIAEVFRSMHTLKGNSSMFGLSNVADLVHQLESIYDEVRSHHLVLTPQIIDFSFQAVDHLSKVMADPNLEKSATSENHHKLISQLTEIIQHHTTTDLSPQKAQNFKTYFLSFEPGETIFNDGTNPLLLVDELSGLGKVRFYPFMREDVGNQHFNPLKCYTSWTGLIATEHSIERIREVFVFAEYDCKVVIDLIAEDDLLRNKGFISVLPKVGTFGKLRKDDLVKWIAQNILPDQEKTAGSANNFKGRSISSIRVPSEKLDALMNHVSELITTQAGLSLYSQNHIHPELEVIADNIEKLSRQLRDVAFGMTLIPIDNLFGRFQRVIRDLSVQLDKSVDFVTEGGETELDKSIIESLSDPLMHMIRNCMDHGIEPKDARKQAGKPEKGTIKLSSFYSGAKVIIQIEDDGKGIDTDQIRQKAIQKQLISPDDQLTDQELFELLFTPGFSTASKVTDVSGRGVGMDVVRKNIAEIRGDITIESVVGKGTKIKLGLPLTLSVIDGLLVKVDETYFIVPLPEVYKCYDVKSNDLANEFNRLMVLDGGQVPFINLRQEFGLPGDQQNTASVVVVHNDAAHLAICVDQIIGEYQAVLKPVGKFYRNQEFVSGATILGNGTVALVLDAFKLINKKTNKVI